MHTSMINEYLEVYICVCGIEKVKQEVMTQYHVLIYPPRVD